MFSIFDKYVNINDDKFTDLFWMNSEVVFMSEIIYDKWNPDLFWLPFGKILHIYDEVVPEIKLLFLDQNDAYSALDLPNAVTVPLLKKS
jgi:hypothetical protein